MNFSRALLISKAALVLILGYMVVRTLLIPKLIENTLSSTSAISTDALHPKDSNTINAFTEDYDDIIKRNPFASSGGSTADIPASEGDSVDTGISKELGIILVGTIAGNLEISRAIIKDLKTSNIEVYRAGQKIADFSIELIDTDAVTLSHNGKRKLLRMDNTQNNEHKTDYTASAAVNNDSDPKPQTPLDSPDQIKTGADKAGEIFKTAVFDPYEVDGQVEGLRITGFENLKIANDIGLKKGDVILKLNGQKLTSKAKAYQVLKKAGSVKTVNVELIRGDKTKQMSFTLP